MATLAPSQLSVWFTIPFPRSNSPVALSRPSMTSTQNWMIAGTGRNRDAIGGIPKDIVEREKKTAV